MRTTWKPFTTLLALTFLFLFCGSSVVFADDFKDGTEVDDPRTELDENELLSPSNASTVFIKEFCLVIFYGFLGVKLSSYIYDVWL